MFSAWTWNDTPEHGRSPNTRSSRSGSSGARRGSSGQRLTAHPNDAATDAKVVLEVLCAGDPEREQACLDDLSCLRERGRENGLCAFLGEVDEVIVRRIVGLARSRAKGP